LLSKGPVSSSYINLVEQSSSGRAKVVAVVDDHRKAFGRAIAGVPVTGPLRDLDAIIREFAVHGVEIDKLLVAGSAGDAEQALETFLSKIRARHKVEIAWLPSLTGLWKKVVPPSELSGASAPSPQLPAYFSHKRQIDICVATASLLILCPLLLAVYVLTLVGVGAPAIFWQRRLGQNGRKFSVLKFRTLRAPYDSRGLPVREDQRLTRVGRFLRRSHLDELLQLVNVLTGDMSLVGPRPLLPADQPEQPSIRLSVPPGMTGWAQINGGVLLSPLEKDRLDEWYIRNASFALDLRILLITVRIAIFGQTKMQDRAGQALPWHREGQAQT
jgi:lipopolysaccharide/colanic/teichoic acid biosynthesis glycosyltransferase